jgi:hypothetical protein
LGVKKSKSLSALSWGPGIPQGYEISEPAFPESEETSFNPRSEQTLEIKKSWNPGVEPRPCRLIHFKELSYDFQEQINPFDWGPSKQPL